MSHNPRFVLFYAKSYWHAYLSAVLSNSKAAGLITAGKSPKAALESLTLLTNGEPLFDPGTQKHVQWSTKPVIDHFPEDPALQNSMFEFQDGTWSAFVPYEGEMLGLGKPRPPTLLTCEHIQYVPSGTTLSQVLHAHQILKGNTPEIVPESSIGTL